MNKECEEKSLFRQISDLYRDSEDFRVRTVENGATVRIVTLDTMCDDDRVNTFVVTPLVCFETHSLAEVEKRISCGVITQKAPSFQAAVSYFVNGHTLVFIDQEDGCLTVDTRIAQGRTVAEPPTSQVMRGPREGFVEDIKVNMTLIRKRLKTPSFKTVNLSVGRYTNTAVMVCYLEGIADKDIADKIIQRIQAIDIDGVLDSSYLSRYLDVNHTVLLHRVGSTEKPDVAVGKLLEGRIAVVVDGSPMVLTLPYLFIEDLQSPGDYYENNIVSSVSRSLRFISVLASVLLPAVYVCLQRYNYQIIPIKFLITILNATEAVPFSALSEMLMVLIIFDILREANLRMPTTVSISLSLVGAIVLGDAAVKAGLLGAPAVMVGALSGIGLYTMPQNSLILSLLRLLITFVGGIMGLFGVILCMFVVTAYMVSLSEYNTPYTAPYGPDVESDRKDAVGMISLEKMDSRPYSFSNVNKTRRGSGRMKKRGGTKKK